VSDSFCELRRLLHILLEAYSRAASQEIAQHFVEPKTHYRVHINSSLDTILSQINPTHHIPSVSLRSVLILFAIHAKVFREVFSLQAFQQIFIMHLIPNVVVEWLTFLLRIREVTGSNLSLETSYPD
jgi:hypothetical protein